MRLNKSREIALRTGEVLYVVDVILAKFKPKHTQVVLSAVPELADELLDESAVQVFLFQDQFDRVVRVAFNAVSVAQNQTHQFGHVVGAVLLDSVEDSQFFFSSGNFEHFADILEALFLGDFVV